MADADTAAAVGSGSGSKGGESIVSEALGPNGVIEDIPVRWVFNGCHKDMPNEQCAGLCFYAVLTPSSGTATQCCGPSHGGPDIMCLQDW